MNTEKMGNPGCDKWLLRFLPAWSPALPGNPECTNSVGAIYRARGTGGEKVAVMVEMKHGKMSGTKGGCRRFAFAAVALCIIALTLAPQMVQAQTVVDVSAN